jgi:PIN domain
MRNFKRKRVFLDTEVFVREGFNFASTKLAEIRRLGSEEAIQVLTTGVTVKESKRRIDKMIRSARNALKNKESRFTLGILQQTSLDCAFLKPIDANALRAEVERRYDDFLSACKTIICDTSSIPADVILDAYFAGQPPFGPGQKKDQFPDAVAIAALELWQVTDKNPIYVVSHDEDMFSACSKNSNLLAIKSVSEFLDAHNRDAKEQAAFVREQIALQREQIAKKVANRFSELGFILLSEDGDIEDVEVLGVEIGHVSIVALHEEYAVAEVSVSIQFSALATYDDSNTGYYDSEDKIMFGMDRVTKSVHRTKELSVDVEMSWEGEELTDLEIIMPLTDVEIELDDDDEIYE